MPRQQQAVVQLGTGGPQVLKRERIAVLEPGDGQVLIRVRAAAVNRFAAAVGQADALERLVDTLAALGAEINETPLTSERVLTAIRAARLEPAR